MVAAGGALRLDAKVYQQLHDVTLMLADGTTTQIDHVIVSAYGIFVVETKNFKGWIFGKEHDRKWTQKIHEGHSVSFQNPLHQNYRHKRALEALLGLPPTCFHDVVIFIGDCTLRTRDELPDCVVTRGWTDYVKRFNDPILSEEQVEAVVAALEEGRMPTGPIAGIKTHRAHVANLSQRHREPASTRR